MDLNNSNLDYKNISCECETKINQRPVDFLGDSVCKLPVSSVREIVKKYEPDKEISVPSNHGINNNNVGNNGGGGVGGASFTNNNNSHTSMRSAPSSLNAKRYNFRKPVLEEQSQNSSYAVQQYPSPLSNFSKEFQDFKDKSKLPIDFVKELADNSYKSKTTIAKTAEGIRITTDIFFDSDSKIPDNWIVKRIETDIPKSKIINDFQKKNNSKR